MKHKAFTLIELLIVVAIIAILAAIAVPNFLEAQTRSQVSRSMADMRTIGIGLESYYVDNNSYISAFWPNKNPVPRPCRPGYSSPSYGKWFVIYETLNNVIGGCGGPLTSPVSYLTTLPYDPFQEHYKVFEGGQDWGLKRGGVFYSADLNCPAAFGIQDPFFWRDDVGYYLQSAGPNLIIFSHEPVLAFYDPTNGTVSAGDLFYLGKGEGFFGMGTR